MDSSKYFFKVFSFSVLCLVLVIMSVVVLPVQTHAAPVTYNLVYTAFSGTGSGAGTVTFDDSLLTPNNNSNNIDDIISLNLTFIGLTGYPSPITFTKSDLKVDGLCFSTDSSAEISDINFCFNDSFSGYKLEGCEEFLLCNLTPTEGTIAEYECHIVAAIGGDGYLVTGAGIPDANGLYCETGEIHNGAPVYQKAGTTWEIFYEGEYWWIDDFERGVADDCTYFNPASTATPPLTGWLDNVGDPELPPTLSEQPCGGAIPTLNEWGMIIFSLLMAGSAFWFIRKERHESC